MGGDSNPWVSSSGEVAHPLSPRGGGGAGAASPPGPIGGSVPDGTAHPQSPAGKNLQSPDGGVAQGLKPSKSKATAAADAKKFPVTLVKFNNKDKGAIVTDIKGHPMGPHPPGNFPFVNAVEIVFKVDADLAKKARITEYRCRQNVFSQEMWERELKDGKVTDWAKTANTGKEPDDPDPLLQATTPPDLAYHDAPGFMAVAKSEQFSGPGGKLTSKTAVMVFLRQNFVGWIDGRRKNKDWEPVSDEVKWHSNQSLVRDILFTQSWNSTDGTEIELGHTQGIPK